MLIPVDVGTAVEPKPVSNGWYEVQVTDCKDTKSQKGNPQLDMSLAIIGHETAPNIRHFVSFPLPDDEPRKLEFKKLLLKRTLTLFKLPITDAIDTEKMAMQFVGAKAKVELELTEPDDNGNVYNRLKVPRLASEGNSGGVPKPPTAKKS